MVTISESNFVKVIRNSLKTATDIGRRLRFSFSILNTSKNTINL